MECRVSEGKLMNLTVKGSECDIHGAGAKHLHVHMIT